MEGAKKDMVVFFGGLNPCLTFPQQLKYVKNYDSDPYIQLKMNYHNPHLNRGFAFIFCSNEQSYEQILNNDHKIGEREIDCKKAHGGKGKTKDILNEITYKIYVKQLDNKVDNTILRQYFSQFGELTHSYVIYDMLTKKTKNFGFIQYKDHEIVSKVLEIKDHIICNKKIECQKYVPRLFAKNKVQNYKAFEALDSLAQEKDKLQRYADELQSEIDSKDIKKNRFQKKEKPDQKFRKTEDPYICTAPNQPKSKPNKYMDMEINDLDEFNPKRIVKKKHHFDTNPTINRSRSNEKSTNYNKIVDNYQDRGEPVYPTNIQQSEDIYNPEFYNNSYPYYDPNPHIPASHPFFHPNIHHIDTHYYWTKLQYYRYNPQYLNQYHQYHNAHYSQYYRCSYSYDRSEYKSNDVSSLIESPTYGNFGTTNIESQDNIQNYPTSNHYIRSSNTSKKQACDDVNISRTGSQNQPLPTWDKEKKPDNSRTKRKKKGVRPETRE